MTENQKENFKLYGCYPMCLIYLYNLKNKSLTIKEFCTRYGQYFFQEEYGRIRPENQKHVLKDMGFRIVEITTEFKRVKIYFSEGKNIVVNSKVNLNRGEEDEIDHASVLEEISDSSFRLWTSSKDGSFGPLLPFSKVKWKSKKCSGLVLEEYGNGGG